MYEHLDMVIGIYISVALWTMVMGFPTKHQRQHGSYRLMAHFIACIAWPFTVIMLVKQLFQYLKEI